jgi:hypothetical protein
MDVWLCSWRPVCRPSPTLPRCSRPFDWVPISENPSSSKTTTASGTLELTLSSFALTGPTQPPNFGPYYASGTASTADITALSYTAADGLSVGLSNVTTESLGSTTVWQTSGDVKPASAASAGYYFRSWSPGVSDAHRLLP